MKRCVRIAAALWLMTLASLVSAAAQDKVTLAYKAVSGQVVRYKAEASITAEPGGQKLTIEAKETQKVTFTTAPSGEITIEQVTESSEVTINGQKGPEDDDKTVSTLVIKPDGTIVSYKSTSDDPDRVKMSARLTASQMVFFSDKPVGVGDKWTREIKGNSDIGLQDAKVDFEVVGMEKVGGVDTVKLQMSYQETGSSFKVKGTVNVEKTSGDIVLSDLDAENLPLFGEAPSKGKLRQERIGGNPLGQAPGTTGVKADEKKPEPKKDKNIDETVKEYEKIPGIVTLYRKKEAGRDTVYMEIKEEQLNKLMLMQVTAITGDSSHVVAGDPINDLLFKFTRGVDERIYLSVPNIVYRAEDKSPIARSVKRSFAEAILDAYKVEAKQEDRKSLLINVSDLFRGDISSLNAAFSQPGGLLGGGSGSYSLDRDKTFITAIKNFPTNLVVESQYHYTKGGAGGVNGFGGIAGTNGLLADPRSILIRVSYNLFALPENNYKPRLADPRIGYFLTEYQNFNNDKDEDNLVRYVYRWNLEKADPKAALSKPVKPIVFWIDNAIPVEYRPTVKEGILLWNKAFEKIGFKDAIEVKQMPDDADWDHADMRYNVIRWVSSPDAGYAVALFRVNPITGQILNANITFDSNFVRYIKLEHQKFINPAAYFADSDPKEQLQANKGRPINYLLCNIGAGKREQAWFGHTALKLLQPVGAKIDEKAYLHEFLREVVAHEMGHVLGLRHNFIASAYHSGAELGQGKCTQETGTVASVMDYTPFNIYALKKKGVDFYSSRVGVYDTWAIQYGYTPVDAKTPEGELYKLRAIASQCNVPGHAYQSDEVADRYDPAVTRFDLGRDPLDYYQRSMQTTRHLLLNLDTRLPKQGESYYEFALAFQQLLGYHVRNAALASRYVGGVHFNRNHKGDPGEKPTLVPVSAQEQKQALRLINTYLFAENAFALPKRFYEKLTDEPYGGMNVFAVGGDTYPIRDMVAGVQRAALNRLFSANVMSRVVNNEYKLGEGADTFTLPYLFNNVHASIWSELPARKNINTLRRQLQRSHLDSLTTMFLSPAASTPEDAKMLAWNQLRQLQSQITLARANGNYDEYTRIHLDESLMRIKRTLDAQQTIGGGASGRVSLLDLLRGAEPGSQQH